MGIHDLLRILKPGMRPANISEFKGKCVAVDMMTWIYRGAYSCNEDINKDKQTDLYLNYPLKMIALLAEHSIKCIAVFDGKDLKAKEKEDKTRSENKAKNLELAAIIEATGETETARKVGKRALMVTPKMINSLIAVLIQLKVKVIVAPYEADAQIAYLCKSKLCDFAISEDSDLIPFGCKKVLFKLQPNGEGMYFDFDRFRNLKTNQNGNVIDTNFNNSVFRDNKEKKEDEGVLFSKELMYIKRMKFINFLEFCVMLGSDYLSSLKGFGVKGGVKLFLTYSNLEIVFHQIKTDKKFIKSILKFNETSDEPYLMKAKKVVSLFILQTVYNPLSNTLVPLNNLSLNDDFNKLLEKYKLSFNSPTDKDEYYGKHFNNYSDFCNCRITPEKDLIEEDTVLNKYFVKYKNLVMKPGLLCNEYDFFSMVKQYIPTTHKDNLQLDDDFIKNEVDDKEQINEDEEKSKALAELLNDKELEMIFKAATKKDQHEENKENFINKKVEELVKGQIKKEQPITSFTELLTLNFKKPKVDDKENEEKNKAILKEQIEEDKVTTEEMQVEVNAKEENVEIKEYMEQKENDNNNINNDNNDVNDSDIDLDKVFMNEENYEIDMEKEYYALNKQQLDIENENCYSGESEQDFCEQYLDLKYEDKEKLIPIMPRRNFHDIPYIDEFKDEIMNESNLRHKIFYEELAERKRNEEKEIKNFEEEEINDDSQIKIEKDIVIEEKVNNKEDKTNLDTDSNEEKKPNEVEDSNIVSKKSEAESEAETKDINNKEILKTEEKLSNGVKIKSMFGKYTSILKKVLIDDKKEEETNKGLELNDDDLEDVFNPNQTRKQSEDKLKGKAFINSIFSSNEKEKNNKNKIPKLNEKNDTYMADKVISSYLHKKRNKETSKTNTRIPISKDNFDVTEFLMHNKK